MVALSYSAGAAEVNLTTDNAQGPWNTMTEPTVFVVNGDLELKPAEGSAAATSHVFSSICEYAFKGTANADGTKPTLTIKDYIADTSKGVYLLNSGETGDHYVGKVDPDTVHLDKDGISFSDFEKVDISGNKGFKSLIYNVYYGVRGLLNAEPWGAFYKYSDSTGVSFCNIGKLFMKDNTLKNEDGSLIYVQPKTEDANDWQEQKLEFKNIGEAVFEGNNATAISSYVRVEFEQIGKLVFANSSKTSGYRKGGAIRVSAPGGSLEFSAPVTYFSLKDCGDVYFLNNKAGYGGAIHITPSTKKNDNRFLMSADKGNIIFKGNTMRVATALGPNFASGGINSNWGSEVLNSIFLAKNSLQTDYSAGHLSFRAQEGKEISFYDPIKDHCPACDTNPDYTPTYFNGESLEEGLAYGGVIRFSGNYVRDYITMTEEEKAAGEDGLTNFERRLSKSYKSGFNMKGHLYGGSLIIEDGAILGRTTSSEWFGEQTSTSFDHHQGILEMSRQGAINVCDATFDGKSAILRTEKDCTLVAGNSHKGGNYDGSIDMGKGFSFDFPHFLETAAKTESMSGLKLNTPLLKLGGKLWVYDNAATYENAVWKNSHRFMVLDTKEVETTEGDMEAIASTVTESDKVESPYTYKGSWTMEWKDADKDGVQDELYAIWTPESDRGAITIDPVKRGALAENSLWSSATNLHTMGNAAMKQLGMARLFNDGRYEKKNIYDGKLGLVEIQTTFIPALSRHIWVQGLGDFSSHETQGDVAGYRYNGGGVAVGMDTLLGRYLGYLGIGLGQVWGRNEARGVHEYTKQESTMGTLYWGKGGKLNSRHSWATRAALSYGQTENRMKSWFGNGQEAHGRFDNKTFFGQLEFIYRTKVRENLYLNFLAGVEYTHGKREAFSESGSYARDFDSSRLENLSLTPGVEVEHTSSLAGKTWVNTLRLSYVGDVYRKQPEARVYGRYSDATWTAYSVDPSRHGIRCGWESALQLNEQWSLNAEYNIEGREKAIYQQVRAGVSYLF